MKLFLALLSGATCSGRAVSITGTTSIVIDLFTHFSQHDVIGCGILCSLECVSGGTQRAVKCLNGSPVEAVCVCPFEPTRWMRWWSTDEHAFL